MRVATGGDTISWWAGSSNGWTKQYLPNGPYTGAWINLCEKAVNGLTENNIQAVIDKIRLYSGDIPIWVSPLNFYVGEGCAATNGNEIPNAGAVLADQFAASDPLVFRGPDLGPLGAGQLRSDNCHPNSAGASLVAGQLVEFWDE